MYYHSDQHSFSNEPLTREEIIARSGREDDERFRDVVEAAFVLSGVNYVITHSQFTEVLTMANAIADAKRATKH